MNGQSAICTGLKSGIKRLLLNVFQSCLYRLLKTRGSTDRIAKIIFVCKGNICRSAFAENLLKTASGAKPLQVESCGLSVKHARPAPVEAQKAAIGFGVNLEGHRSKCIDPCRFDDADLVLAMEFSQYQALVRQFPHLKGKIRLLREYSSFPHNLLCNIDDPYGQAEERFSTCFALIHNAISNLNRKCG